MLSLLSAKYTQAATSKLHASTVQFSNG